jgi:Tripartite tricarboxylate transporter family receptor
MTDLAAVIPLGNMPVVLVVNPSKGYKHLSDFVAAAKARPGTVNYASAGAGNSSHLNGERFRLAAGFEAVHLPFKGAPEALTEVVAGRADFYFAPLINALPLLKDGQLQALAVSGSTRALLYRTCPRPSKRDIRTPSTTSGRGCSRRQKLRRMSARGCMQRLPRRSSIPPSARSSTSLEPIRCL